VKGAIRSKSFSGDVQEIVQVLEDNMGVNPVVEYSEMLDASGTIIGHKLDLPNLRKRQKLIKALRKVHTSIGETMMQDALYKVGSSSRLKSKAWMLIQEDVKTWARDVGERLRCMMRHVAQVVLKNKPPHWAHYYMPVKPDIEESSPVKEKAKKHKLGIHSKIVRRRRFVSKVTPPACESVARPPDADAADDVPAWEEAKNLAAKSLWHYKCGWDHEKKTAYRQVDPIYGKGNKEYTGVISPGALPTACVEATWPDGFKSDINFATSEWLAMQGPQKKRKAPTPVDPAPVAAAPVTPAAVAAKVEAPTATKTEAPLKRRKKEKAVTSVPAGFVAKVAAEVEDPADKAEFNAKSACPPGCPDCEPKEFNAKTDSWIFAKAKKAVAPKPKETNEVWTCF